MAPHATLTIENTVANVAVARAFAVRLADLVLPGDVQLEKPAVDVIALLVSELVTNAVEHGEGPVKIEITDGNGCLRVEILDDSAAEPRPREAAPDALSGRGLEIVEKLAQAWGFEPLPVGGKKVWFEY